MFDLLGVVYMKNNAKKIFELCLLNREFLMDIPEYLLNALDERSMIVKDQNIFDVALDNFMSLNEVKLLSKKMVLVTIRKTLLNCKELDESNIDDRVEKFAQYINDFERIEYKAARVFHGVSINEPCPPITLGSVVIYSLPRHNNEIKSLFTIKPEFSVSNFFNRDNPSEKVVVECSVFACDHWKAQEISNVIYNKFELLLTFLLSDRFNEFSFGITRMIFAPNQGAIVSSSSGIFSAEQGRKNFSGNLEISDLSEFLPKDYEWLFNLLCTIVLSPQTALDRKISSAVEWLGESYTDTSRASSYLKSVISLEALLKIDEIGVVTPSIMSSIAEQCAHLNGNTMPECIAIEKKVKLIYAERSKIAHTGSSSVSVKELRDTRDFVRTTILKFITYKEDMKLNKPEQFQVLIRESKYSSGGLINRK
jgi:hypothetical protein